MARRKFKLTDGQVQELKQAYDNCKHGPTCSRYLAVRLYGTGYPVSEVMEITGCSRTSLMDWCRIYRRQGIAGLVDQRAGGNSAKLTGAQIEQVQAILHGYSPREYLGREGSQGTGEFWTVPDVARLVQRLYNITYQSSTSYRSLMKTCGLSLKKPAAQYKSRSESKVMAFEDRLEKNSSIPRKSSRTASLSPQTRRRCIYKLPSRSSGIRAASRRPSSSILAGSPPTSTEGSIS